MTKGIERMSAAAYHEMRADDACPRQKKRKWKNKPQVYVSPLNGERTYHSIKEAKYAAQLDAQVARGEILSWIEQVRFSVPNGKHVIDFLLFLPDEKYRLVEVKGRDLPLGKLKRATVERDYKVKVSVV
jgi:hypothetical protein